MDTASIIAQIDEQISQLQQARAILTGPDAKKPMGRPKATRNVSLPVATKPARREMSAEGKAKIAAAQKACWVKVRKTAKKVKTKTSKV